MTITCRFCADAKRATRIDARTIRCHVGSGGPRLDGQRCAYTLRELQEHVDQLRAALANTIAIRNAAEADEMERCYWLATVNPDRPTTQPTVMQPYTSQRGVFAAEIAAAKCITQPAKCDQPSDNPICPTCANHDGECVCVTECNLGSRYERRGM